MRIGGWQKVSLIDFPGRIATVVFTQGCNWRCPWCHNPELVHPEHFAKPIEPRTVLAWLARRHPRVDGVVISGGEPTLQPGLESFIRQCRKIGCRIKLDTNGSRPDVLARLLGAGLLDHVAMDIKAPPSTYPQLCGVPVEIEPLMRSIQYLRQVDIACEFRTTLVPGMHNLDDACRIADWLEGSLLWVIQTYRPGPQEASWQPPAPPFTRAELDALATHARTLIQRVELRTE